MLQTVPFFLRGTLLSFNNVYSEILNKPYINKKEPLCRWGRDTKFLSEWLNVVKSRMVYLPTFLADRMVLHTDAL